MFEQSMLLDSAAGKKAGALAASLTLQTLGLGTLLLIPLVYTDQLNFVPLFLPVVLRLTPDPPAPERPRHPQRPEARVRAAFLPGTRADSSAIHVVSDSG